MSEKKISLTEAVRLARGELKPPSMPIQFDGDPIHEPSAPPEAKSEPKLEDLTMLLRRAAVRLRLHADYGGDQKLADQITDYLRRHELAGGILR